MFNLSYIIQPFGHLQGCDSVLQKGCHDYQLFVFMVKEINVMYHDVVKSSKMVRVPDCVKMYVVQLQFVDVMEMNDYGSEL
jgi:hypothetical protein